MRFLSTTAVLLGLAASVYAAPKPAAKAQCSMDNKACAAACAKVMKANGIKGTCSPEMCKTGKCPLKAKGIKCPCADGNCKTGACTVMTTNAKGKAGTAMTTSAKGKASTTAVSNGKLTCPAGGKTCPMAKK